MKIINIIIALIIILFSSYALGQEKLFIPRNIQSAYEKGTRSSDGKPGKEYWQNSADYKIDVEVIPSSYQIIGNEKVTYYNNSPDSLTRIVLRLYPNIFKKGSARDYSINPDAIADGVSINKIEIDGLSINLENRSIFRVTSTIAVIYLPESVPAKSSIDLSIDWSFYLPTKATLRMGVYDSTSVFVGYWYPQVAVYDDIEGWDYHNYGGQVEFYNDFSNFDVSITLPNNFGVWATGELQNPEEVLSENIYERYSTAKESDEVVRIVTATDLNLSTIYNNDENKNTWVYKASNVSDFAFAFSDNYLWDGVRTIIDNSNNQSVFVQAVYPVNSPDFYDVAEVSRDLINYFSYDMPGVKFPFPSVVAFNNGRSGGGGMEFPMMINDGSPDVWENTVSLTAHELAHQYFPFFVGTNEKKYAFMDEGWAVMLPYKYMEKLTGINSRLISTVGNYEYLAGKEDDIPMMIPSLSLPYNSYRNSAYDKSSIAYDILRDILGDELFLKALQEYIYRWSGKHPTPNDFYFTFNDVTGENLNWFWRPWFFETGYPDLAIDRVLITDKAEITIRKVGNMPTPVKFKVIYENETSEEYYFPADVWKDGADLFSIEIKLSDILKEIQLGDFRIPDSNRDNNQFLVH
ncbi:MAG: M1 family metallopeptidase [Ignavibacteriaceae bacterium]|nr:M1 family metallopeptidase [Ignavibacteriaceae bacterium]